MTLHTEYQEDLFKIVTFKDRQNSVDNKFIKLNIKFM